MWTFDETIRDYPLLLDYRTSTCTEAVVKQADLVMALFYGGEMSPEQKPEFAFYERLPPRLVAVGVIQAVVAAEAFTLNSGLRRTPPKLRCWILMPLTKTRANGVDIRSWAGAWTAALAGPPEGLGDRRGRLCLPRRLLQALIRLVFSTCAHAETEPEEAQGSAWPR